MISTAKSEGVDAMISILKACAPDVAPLDFAALIASVGQFTDIVEPARIPDPLSGDEKPADAAPEVQCPGQISLPEPVGGQVTEVMGQIVFETPKQVNAPKRVDRAEISKHTLHVDSSQPQILVVVEVTRPQSPISLDIVSPVLTPVLDVRAAFSMPSSSIDKCVPIQLDRSPAVTAQIADVARDVLNVTTDKDVHFTVRPEALGPVAVRIERGDAGPSLRLGVETQAAVQAVRQAEPMLSDSRSNAPFVQVTIDLNSSAQRGRSVRQIMQSKPRRSESSENVMTQAPVIAARYA